MRSLFSTYGTGERVIFEDGLGERVRGRIVDRVKGVLVKKNVGGTFEYTIRRDDGVLEEHVPEADIWPA